MMRHPEETAMRFGWCVGAAFWTVLAATTVAGAQGTAQRDCSDAQADPDRIVASCSSILDSSGLPPAGQIRALTNRGLAQTRKGAFDDAIADFDNALRIDPDDGRARNARGIAFRRKGEYDRAIADYDVALRRNPRDVRALNNRGVAYRWKRDYDRSITDTSAAIAVDPKYALAYSNRAVAYRLKLDYPRALADHDNAVRLTPQSGPFHYERGRTYEAKEDDVRALADYRKAVSLDPTSKTPAQSVARIERRLTVAREAAPAPSGTQPIGVRPPAGKPAPTQQANARPPANVQPNQAPPAAQPGQPRTEARVALVIGNSRYSNTSALTNPKNDATALAAALERVGFTKVTLKLDLSREQVLQALKAFASESERADWAVVYFAGHGMEVGGVNYLVPVDAKLVSDRDITFEAVPLEQVLQAVDGARKLRLVVLDACRDNPFVKTMTKTAGKSRSIGNGLANIEPEGATLVAYAAKHGQVALDGTTANSPFVTSLIKNLGTPGLEINLLFRKVRDEVLTETGKRQEPFTYGSLPAEAFYFKKP
jgi:tetratricopeptide (TPR) repeat protein